MMDLKPLDLVWVDGLSTSWSHPGELSEFSDIPGLAIISDTKDQKKRPLLSQVSLPAHRLPPSEFDPAPTLALYAENIEGMQDKSVALQLSLFPSAIYCHIPGGDKQWRAALIMEREVFMQHSLSKSVMADSHQAHLPNELPLRKEGTARRSRSISKPVICEFRRTAGLMPQLSKYMKPAGRNVVIRFVQDDDLERPRR
jgi:hypothetical protein